MKIAAAVAPVAIATLHQLGSTSAARNVIDVGGFPAMVGTYSTLKELLLHRG